MLQKKLIKEDNIKVCCKKFFYSGVLIICLVLLGIFSFRGEKQEEQVAQVKEKEYLKPKVEEQEVEEKTTAEETRVPFLEKEKKVYIGIIIDDLGLNKKLLKEVLEMPTFLTLGFSPYANDVTTLIEIAKDKGFQSLLKLPMQTRAYPLEDLGPYALMDNFSDQENEDRIEFIINKSDDIVGLYANPKEIFTDLADNVEPLLHYWSRLKNSAKNNMIFMYMDEQDKKPVSRIASELGVTSSILPMDIWIDEKLDEQFMKKQLMDIESIALSRGVAVGIIGPYPLSFKVLREWMADLDSQHLEILPVTYVLQKVLKLATEVPIVSEETSPEK